MLVGVLGDVVAPVETLEGAVLAPAEIASGKAVDRLSTWVTNGTTSAATTARKLDHRRQDSQGRGNADAQAAAGAATTSG